MAWIDDRIWCHPKFTDLSGSAFRTYINGLAYSAGFGTGGRLTPGQQKAIGSSPKNRQELVKASLWEITPDGIQIHNWDDRNGKRDARRVADRERKRAQRAAEKSARLSAGQSAGTSTLPARVEGSEGSDLKSKYLSLRASAPVTGQTIATASVIQPAIRAHLPYDPPSNPASHIRRLIRNGVISDHIELEAELRALNVNGTTATELRALIPQAEGAA